VELEKNGGPSMAVSVRDKGKIANKGKHLNEVRRKVVMLILGSHGL
jgi:hypothetical protein